MPSPRRAMLLPRPAALQEIVALHRIFSAVALLGPRQCGKTTLAGMVAEEQPAGTAVTVFDLEREADSRRLRLPERTLGPLSGLVVLDEVQHLPSLFTALRPLIDRPGAKTKYLLLGSVSPTIVKGVSESLAGRIGYLDLSGFVLGEVVERGGNWGDLWERGGLPSSYLAPDDRESRRWREGYFRSFLSRDHESLGIAIPAAALRRFWNMLAHCHGQTWNAAEFARAIGNGPAAARRCLDILSGSFAVRVLAPWHENLKKRQVRAPKVYVRDTGLLHSLLRIRSGEELAGHPKVGASFEGFVIEQVLAGVDERDAWFWGTHGGAELDLLLFRGGKRYGVEVKYTDAPRVTRSMRTALADLDLERLYLVYPGEERYDLDERIEVLPVTDIPALWPPYGG